MMHVKQIREIIAEGKNEEAHSALEELLVLGPKNTEALKLRAMLYAMEGRFNDEARVWARIAEIDNEDPDAIAYYTQRQLEDREHFYFTDDIVGGRRFLAYPRKLVNASVVGLFGCIAFLLGSRAALSYPQLSDPYVMGGMFFVLVAAPWIALLVAYFRSLRSISVTNKGITFSSRLSTKEIAWPEVEKLCLARIGDPENPGLTLVVIPKDKSEPLHSIDLTQSSTSIRARSHFLREIARSFSEPEYTSWDTLGAENRRIRTY